ncbi:hypothetical protein L2E82_17550 [Cichorium intybus]|uniref:Uncharacterized protein n=1 Tax=Cichorium intybus TaxID=13427 RepID=A0ACB9F8Z8_CICIN|nr:hypothetical protein L2E82_17550 [Cichorium intybus]
MIIFMMIKAGEKHTALHLALSELAGDFDGESMMFLQRFFGARVKHVVSTGSLKLDLALGIGDPMLLEMVGVNTKNLLILQENPAEKHTALHSAENLLSIVDTLTQSGADDVIVINSVRKSFQKTLMALERYSYYIYKSGEIKFEITQGVRVNEFFGYGKIDGVRKEYTLALETVIG